MRRPDEHQRGVVTAPPIPLPRYGTASIADLVPSLLHALGGEGFDGALGIEPAPAICLFVVDGLGWELLRDHAAEAPFLSGASSRSLTTGFPSTTAASLASLGTGRPPGEHGLVGYTMLLPGETAPINNLSWGPYGVASPATVAGEDLIQRLIPEQVQPEPTAFERGVAAGLRVTLVGPRQHAQSGMTRAVLRGGRYRPAFGLADLVAVTAAALAEPGPPQLVYAYHPDLDLVGHIRGAGSDAWSLQLAEIDMAAAALAERLPPGAMLAVTGDHGMVDLGPLDRVDVGDVPALLAGVRVLAGEARARLVYTEPGAADDVLAAWRDVVGDRMWVVSRDQAIAAGWFGPRVSDRIRPRIGDVVAAAYGRIGVMQRTVDPAHARLIGHHGSMTPREQLVPLVTVRRE
jgi:hypothetical protein